MAVLPGQLTLPCAGPWFPFLYSPSFLIGRGWPSVAYWPGKLGLKRGSIRIRLVFN